jgi:DNA-directed RNA polymerase subunit F
VDEANPAYKAARDAWAGPSRYMDAVERGRGILKPSESAEEFANRFRALPDAEKEAERIGAVSSIIGRMGSDSAKLGDMTKYLRSPEVRAKIAAIMPNEEAAASWQRRLDFEVGSSELTGRALGNSATARRLAERQDAENLMGDLVMDALQGSPQSFVRKVLGAGPKWLRDTMRSKADALLADVLTNPDKAGQLPRVLQRAQNISAPASGQTNAAATAAGASLFVP